MIARKPQEGLVYQRRRLQRVSRRLMRHLPAGQFTQFGVNEIQQLPAGPYVPGVHRRQKPSYFVFRWIFHCE